MLARAEPFEWIPSMGALKHCGSHVSVIRSYNALLRVAHDFIFVLNPISGAVSFPPVMRQNPSYMARLTSMSWLPHVKACPSLLRGALTCIRTFLGPCRRYTWGTYPLASNKCDMESGIRQLFLAFFLNQWWSKCQYQALQVSGIYIQVTLCIVWVCSILPADVWSAGAGLRLITTFEYVNEWITNKNRIQYMPAYMMRGPQRINIYGN
jgi:hypothetical protein